MVLLDAFAEDADLLTRYRTAYRAMLDARAAFRELQESEMANAREIDFLQHQVEEIESANLTAEEVEGLEARWQRARNAGRLRDTVMPMAQALDGDEDAVLPRLHRIIRSAHDLERLDAAAAKWLEPSTARWRNWGTLRHPCETMRTDCAPTPRKLPRWRSAWPRWTP